MPGESSSHSSQVELGPITVKVENISVQYRVRSSHRDTDGAGGTRRDKRQSGYVRAARGLAHAVLPQRMHTVKALNGVSFYIRSGESLGVVGLNGSGKSTLLRTIAGLQPPTSGAVFAAHQPILLGVSSVLQPQLSGLQNARLGCLALGLSPEETQVALPKIEEHANLGRAFYLPMNTYSSGMGSRLRFSIATSVNAKVLLIDEALNTGDAASKQRSEDRMNELRQKASTVVLVSHAAQTVEEICSRAIWLHEGKLIADGDAYSVAREYRAYAWALAKGNLDTAEKLLAKRVG